MSELTSSPGELVERLVDAADDPSPQIRAVVTTMLIKSLDLPDASEAISQMVRSDAAAMIVDRVGAERAKAELDGLLVAALLELSVAHGEAAVIRAWRSYLLAQMDRWAATAVDNADNRRRAERLLVLAEHPVALASAQRRGFLEGLTSEDVRALARTRVEGPVSPETATTLWAQRDAWLQRLDERVGERVVAAWERLAKP
jgi:phage FluMu protein gp41